MVLVLIHKRNNDCEFKGLVNKSHEMFWFENNTIYYSVINQMAVQVKMNIQNN